MRPRGRSVLRMINRLVVLLVDPEHPRVQALYETWGFRKVGKRRPFPDSPVYAVMLAELPLS